MDGWIKAQPSPGLSPGGVTAPSPPSLPPSLGFYLQPGASQQHPARGWPAWPARRGTGDGGDAGTLSSLLPPSLRPSVCPSLPPCGAPEHRGAHARLRARRRERAAEKLVGCHPWDVTRGGFTPGMSPVCLSCRTGSAFCPGKDSHSAHHPLKTAPVRPGVGNVMKNYDPHQRGSSPDYVAARADIQNINRNIPIKRGSKSS